MLLTLTTTHRPATDLGFLLRKNPARAQVFDLSFGKAHVFYPEADEGRCTAALLVEVDPVALADVFGTALTGACMERPELADLPLRAILSALPRRGGEAFLRKLFEPLGYHVNASRLPLDEVHPDWGENAYHRVEIEAITRRYLKHQRSLVNDAFAQLADESAPHPDETAESQAEEEAAVERALSLNEQRLGSVLAALKATGAAFERVLFECARPASIVLTTPNREYNIRWESLPVGKFRHRDHRFEWTRAEFQTWAHSIAERFGYHVRFLPVGPEDAEVGSPTQMGVFESIPSSP